MDGAKTCSYTIRIVFPYAAIRSAESYPHFPRLLSVVLCFLVGIFVGCDSEHGISKRRECFTDSSLVGLEANLTEHELTGDRIETHRSSGFPKVRGNKWEQNRLSLA